MKNRVLICAVIALLWLQNIYAQNTYTNPVIRKYLADPSVIKANDGWFYVYTTESAGLAIPIYKSQNLVDWTFVGSAFAKAGRPTFVKNTRVRDKKRLEKVGNLVKNSYLYR